MEKVKVGESDGRLGIVGELPVREVAHPPTPTQRAEWARRAFAEWLVKSAPDTREIDLAELGGEFIAAVAELVLAARPMHERGVRERKEDDALPLKLPRKGGRKSAGVIITLRDKAERDGSTRVAFLLREAGFTWKEVFRFMIPGYDEMPRSERGWFTQPLRVRVTAKRNKASKRSGTLTSKELIEVATWLLSKRSEKL